VVNDEGRFLVFFDEMMGRQWVENLKVYLKTEFSI
jgi:hypothetical protein